MKAIRQAIYSKLTGDVTLAALLASSTSVYHHVAPDEAQFPLVIFNLHSGTPRYTFEELAWDDQVWLLKGVVRADTANPSSRADDIAARLDALLTDGTLTIAGANLMSLRRESDFQYPEVEKGKKYRHAGALYRLRFQ